MTTRLIASSAALLVLAACNPKTTTNTVVASSDPMSANFKAPPVELPPSIKSTKAYRCADNSVVYVDLFNGDQRANVRQTGRGESTVLRSEQPGQPLIADGYEVIVNGESLSVTRPGHPKQKCDV